MSDVQVGHWDLPNASTVAVSVATERHKQPRALTPAQELGVIPNSPVYGYCPFGHSYLYNENRICVLVLHQDCWKGIHWFRLLGLELGTCAVSCIMFIHDFCALWWEETPPDCPWR